MDRDKEAFDEIVRGIRSGDPAIKAAVTQELQRLAVPRRRPEATHEPGKDWYLIRVELISGRAEDFEPPPGRDILISPQHTFRQFAEAINSAFARWDLGHLYMFRLAAGTAIGIALEELPHREAARTKIGQRDEGEIFEYEFDFGDGSLHRCTVLEVEVDPEDVYGVRPKGPVAVWGWGRIPDQYGRTTPDG